MANPMPAAEFEITADLVRRLLAGQHQDLAGLPVEPLASGWDNTLFRLGDALVARLPRRAAGASIVVNEQRWLPLLAPRLPLPVPVPVRTGVPGEGYPWPWSVVPFLPGVPASDEPPFDPSLAARDLGGFFGALHVPAPPDTPANPYRGVPLERRAATFEQNLATLDPAGLDLAVPGAAAPAGRTGRAGRDLVLATWESALAVPAWDGPPVWLHGDPHPANILISDGRVCGVLDFGDITAGDPASDLSIAWMLLPASCHGDFRAAYAMAGGTPIGEETWARGRGWALNLGIVFLAWSADNPSMREIGRRTVAAVLAAEVSRLASGRGDREQCRAIDHDDLEARQVAQADRGAALDEQVGRVPRHAVAGRRDEPAGDDSALARPGDGDELALERAAHVGQVERDLSAPALGHQADRAGDAVRRVGGGVQLPGQAGRRRGRAWRDREPDADAAAGQHDDGGGARDDQPAAAAAARRGAPGQQVDGGLDVAGNLDRVHAPQQPGDR